MTYLLLRKTPQITSYTFLCQVLKKSFHNSESKKYEISSTLSKRRIWAWLRYWDVHVRLLLVAGGLVYHHEYFKLHDFLYNCLVLYWFWEPFGMLKISECRSFMVYKIIHWRIDLGMMQAIFKCLRIHFTSHL